MQPWIMLAVAIISEVAATSALKVCDGFTRLWPSIIVVAGYGTSLTLLSLVLKTLPVGVVYAIWSGTGIALIVVAAWLFLGQSLDLPAIVGLLLIVAGVVVLRVFSKAVATSQGA
ncbi:MAG: QacE family quaternary ammonium compound efflux SMR transporter [Methylococcaceae bacterium]|nr:QacE family quaternary ammonium compound efflux SMR transporter [Methylococcaceae bacterium]